MGWFEVDRKGLKALIAGRSKSLVLRELIQNAWDEPSVTEVKVTTAIKNGMAIVRVEDDAPEGFYDLRHAYTLFADTRKRNNPQQRGRFNLGEKEVLSLCDSGQIKTTKGTVMFLPDGERQHLSLHRQKGSEIELELEMSEDEYQTMLKEVQGYIVPEGINTIINGALLQFREPIQMMQARLQTEVSKNGGVMQRTIRKTTISIYQPENGEVATLYEMGLPVCETGDTYHYDIGQKIPLGTDRETVSAAFLRDVRAEVANAIIGDIDEDDISENWIRDAMSDERISNEAVCSIVQKRFGDDVVVATPSDPRSAERAIENGYRVLRPKELSKEEWDNIRKAGAVPSSHSLFPTSTVPGVLIPQKDWTAEQKKTANFAKWFAKHTLGIDHLRVKIFESEQATVLADYSSGVLRLNRTRIGQRAWATPSSGFMLELIIHELGHEGGRHFDHEYHKTLCHIAAMLPELVKKYPRRW